MKFPIVLVEAKPKAAPPIAEKDIIHSGCSPPTRPMASTAPIKIRIRNVSTKLFVTLGSSLARLANLDRYLVNSLSRAMATAAMIIIPMMAERSIPNKFPSAITKRHLSANCVNPSITFSCTFQSNGLWAVPLHVKDDALKTSK